MFLWYIMLREASKGRYDIIVTRPGYGVLVFPRHGDAYCAEDLRQARWSLPEDGAVLQLVDQKFEGGHCMYNVILAGPERANTRAAEAAQAAMCTEYMPSWEMEKAGFRKLCREEQGEKYSEDVVSDVEACWGCIPRYALDDVNAKHGN